VEELIQSKMDLPKPTHAVMQLRGSADCFRRLPVEIQGEIAAYLETLDTFNLRLASRTMSAIFWSQVFWKSRFNTNGDRGFLRYLIDSVKGSRRLQPSMNWRLLYHCTNQSKIYGRPIWNRKRIWTMNRWLTETTTMIMEPDTSPDTSVHEEKLNTADHWEWKEIQGDIRNGTRPAFPAVTCYPQTSYRQIIYMSYSYTRANVSILRERDMTYITGMEFISQNQPNIIVGYKITGGQITIDIKSLKGFEVAIGSGGIRALRFITNSNASKWLGNPTDAKFSRWLAPIYRACTTMRLMFDVDIDALEFTCNVCLLYPRLTC
jgi:hypothetical protein